MQSFFDSAPPLTYVNLISQKFREFVDRISRSSVCESHETVVKKSIRNYHKAVEEGLLLKLPFTTIFEYLQILQKVAISIRCLGPYGMFYLPAAVSDFYVPWETMAKHKIQSASGPLDMRLTQVPKMLSELRREWAPSAFCISFKLETDPDILLQKAYNAVRKYQMHIVVANESTTYKHEVVVLQTVGEPSFESRTEMMMRRNNLLTFSLRGTLLTLDKAG